MSQFIRKRAHFSLTMRSVKILSTFGLQTIVGHGATTGGRCVVVKYGYECVFLSFVAGG